MSPKVYQLSTAEIEFNNGMYADFCKKYGATPEGLGWNSQHDQEVRFEILLKLIPLVELDMQKATLLDVGCGFADLCTYLKARYPGMQYTGIDINPKALEIARARHPHAQFILGDILHAPLSSFDIICCSGLFATKLQDNEAFIRSMILQMGKLAKKGFGFNFLRKTGFPSDLAEYDKVVIKKFCKQHFPKIKVYERYLGNEDVTIFVLK